MCKIALFSRRTLRYMKHKLWDRCVKDVIALLFIELWLCRFYILYKSGNVMPLTTPIIDGGSKNDP